MLDYMVKEETERWMMRGRRAWTYEKLKKGKGAG